MVDFSDYKIKVKIDKCRPVDYGNMETMWNDKIFKIIIGFKPREWSGEQYTKRDIPLIEGHEIEHALMRLDGSDQGCMRPMWAIYFSERVDIAKHILRIEKEAWRRFFDGLNYTPIEWVVKAQTCMNCYLEKTHKSLKIYDKIDDFLRWLFVKSEK